MQEFSSKRQTRVRELRPSQILFLMHTVLFGFFMALYTFVVSQKFIIDTHSQWLYILPLVWGIGLGLNYLTSWKSGQRSRVAKFGMTLHYSIFLITTTIFAVMLPQTFGNTANHYQVLFLFLMAWLAGVGLHYASFSYVTKNHTRDNFNKTGRHEEWSDSSWPPLS